MHIFDLTFARVTRVIALGLMALTLATPAMAAAVAQPRDADLNSIMYAGAYSKAEWLGKVQNGDTQHTAANLQQIYYNEGRGITQANFLSSSTVDGIVYKDGRVIVGNKTVATGSRSVGRFYSPGSVKSGSVWERPSTAGFTTDSIQAFVDMEGGVFHYAILKSCGNAVVATPVVQVTPSPTPTVTPSPSPTPAQLFQCVMLTPTRPDQNGHPSTFRFTITSRIENVTLTGYRFSVHQRGSNSATDVKDIDATNNFAEYTLGEGTWDVQGQVKTTAGITQTAPACSTSVVVSRTTPVPSPTPAPSGQVLGATLPSTGPEVMFGGVAGLTAMAYSAKAYKKSRKNLLDAHRGKQL